ncbi:hypothetical protein J6590_029969 [Homalodisca vitripennis]|nr:hypothetical protein J6590_029969 [Homalodisca vitripennis]
MKTYDGQVWTEGCQDQEDQRQMPQDLSIQDAGHVAITPLTITHPGVAHQRIITVGE